MATLPRSNTLKRTLNAISTMQFDGFDGTTSGNSSGSSGDDELFDFAGRRGIARMGSLNLENGPGAGGREGDGQAGKHHLKQDIRCTGTRPRVQEGHKGHGRGAAPGRDQRQVQSHRQPEAGSQSPKLVRGKAVKGRSTPPAIPKVPKKQDSQSDGEAPREAVGRCRAVFAYGGPGQTLEATNIPMAVGETFEVIRPDQKGWTKVRRVVSQSGRGREEGYVPTSYLTLIPEGD